MSELLQKYSSILQTRYQASGLPRFLGWWLAELRPLIPAGLKRWFAVPGEKLLITSVQDEWLLWRCGSSMQLLDRMAMETDPEQSRDRLQACMDRFREALTAMIYCLPQEQMLCKRLRLPMAAEANLQQAVTFELDRQTPFKADEVYFDVQVVQREAPFIDIDLYIIQRQIVDNRLQQLARLGLTLQGVDIDQSTAEGAEITPPQPLHINLLPREQRVRRGNRRVRINWMLAGSAAALLVLLMAETLYLRGATVEQLQRQRDALRSAAMQVTKLQQQLDEAVDAANFLADQQAGNPDLLDVIAEVTQRLPGHTWIQRLQMSGMQLEILGLSDSSQQMVELLDKSEMFDHTSFKGTIATDQRLNKERFTATAEINPGVRFVSSNHTAASTGEEPAAAADDAEPAPADASDATTP